MAFSYGGLMACVESIENSKREPITSMDFNREVKEIVSHLGGLNSAIEEYATLTKLSKLKTDDPIAKKAITVSVESAYRRNRIPFYIGLEDDGEKKGVISRIIEWIMEKFRWIKDRILGLFKKKSVTEQVSEGKFDKALDEQKEKLEEVEKLINEKSDIIDQSTKEVDKILKSEEAEEKKVELEKLGKILVDKMVYLNRRKMLNGEIKFTKSDLSIITSIEGHASFLSSYVKEIEKIIKKDYKQLKTKEDTMQIIDSKRFKTLIERLDGPYDTTLAFGVTFVASEENPHEVKYHKANIDKIDLEKDGFSIKEALDAKNKSITTMNKHKDQIAKYYEEAKALIEEINKSNEELIKTLDGFDKLSRIKAITKTSHIEDKPEGVVYFAKFIVSSLAFSLSALAAIDATMRQELSSILGEGGAIVDILHSLLGEQKPAIKEAKEIIL